MQNNMMRGGGVAAGGKEDLKELQDLLPLESRMSLPRSEYVTKH